LVDKYDLGTLRKTDTIIPLADQSTKIPRGILKDVIVKVDDFHYPVEFFIMDTELPYKDVDVVDEEVQKHAPRMLKDDSLELYLTDLKGTSPSLCMHRIVRDPYVKTSRDAQRRLNLNIKEVVKKKVLKWLDAGIIYPISDSKWVSPTQMVPKNASITVVETESREKLTTRPMTG
nr:putative reverse transcriptase domain, zinc finger, CCHC-type, retrotransposon Gag domain protein [Tanacetum cinerariifolium]